MPAMRAEETPQHFVEIAKKQVAQERPTGQVVERTQDFILPLQELLVSSKWYQVRVQQRTAESKERSFECVDEQIVDVPVVHWAQEVIGASWEPLQTTSEDLVQEKAV